MSSPSACIYLDCPKEEKDNVKALGAKWDAARRKWFVPAAMYPILHQFNRWRPDNKVYLNCPYKDKDDAKAAGAKFDGHVKKWYTAALPSNSKVPAKFARWLDAESFSSSGVSTKECPASGSGEKKKQQKQQPKTGTKASKSEKDDSKSKKETKKASDKKNAKKDTQPSKKAAEEKKKEATATTTSPHSSSSLASLPRVSSSLSMAQLQHELLQRDPSAKGLSNKNKALLLSRLGEGSIWITSPESPVDASFLTSLPRVTPSLTAAQLCHELLCRAPASKGTSGKNKAWFLSLLGEGSIWMTAPNQPKLPSQTKPSSSSSSSLASSRKTPSSSKRASVPATAPEPKKRKATPPTAKPKEEGGGKSAKSQNEDEGRSIKKTKREEKPTTKTPLTIKKESSKKTPAAATPIKREPKRTPSKTTAAAAASPAPSQTSPAAKRVQTTLEQALSKATTSSSSSSSSNNNSQTTFEKKRPLSSKLELATKCARRTPPPSRVVHPSMTLGELRDECRTRNIKGFSGKSKEWLLSQLGEGTERLAILVPDSSCSYSSTVKMETEAHESETETEAHESETSANDAFHFPKKPSTVKTETPPGSPDMLPDAATSSSSMPAVAANVKSSVTPNAVASPAVTTTTTTKRREAQTQMPVVSASMTLEELREECRARDPEIRGMSGKNKAWFLSHLGLGSARRASAEWKAQAEREAQKADEEAQRLHIHNCLCHIHLLADSSQLRAPPKRGRQIGLRRNHVAICDFERIHPYFCQKTPYRTCEACDFDICRECHSIESLREPEREKVLREKHERLRQRQLEAQRRSEEERRQRQREHEEWRRKYEEEREREMEELYGDDLKRFPKTVRNPKHMNEDQKLKYTVWKRSVHRKQEENGVEREFDSSFASLREANLRAEYLFYYGSDYGRGHYEIHATKDEEVNDMRYLRMDPDGGGSWIVSVMPSEAFDVLAASGDCDDDEEEDSVPFVFSAAVGRTSREPEDVPTSDSFPSRIRDLSSKCKDEKRKLAYTVWTSCGYDYDGWHSYEGPPQKEFDSSFASLEDANERAKYVFFHKNPWGLDPEEEMHTETNRVTKNGYRFLECCPDDSERWTVSVIASIAFDHM